MDFCRKELRWACDPRIVLAHLDGCDEPIEGQVVEVSRAGVQLHVQGPIAVGTLVTIHVGTLVLLGDVRHCDANPNAYYTVGLQTCDVQHS